MPKDGCNISSTDYFQSIHVEWQWNDFSLLNGYLLLKKTRWKMKERLKWGSFIWKTKIHSKMFAKMQWQIIYVRLIFRRIFFVGINIVFIAVDLSKWNNELRITNGHRIKSCVISCNKVQSDTDLQKKHFVFIHFEWEEIERESRRVRVKVRDNKRALWGMSIWRVASEPKRIHKHIRQGIDIYIYTYEKHT